MNKEEQRKELEKILVLLGECFLEHDTSGVFCRFLSNVVVARRDLFFVDNKWVISKLEEFLKDSLNKK